MVFCRWEEDEVIFIEILKPIPEVVSEYTGHVASKIGFN